MTLHVEAGFDLERVGSISFGLYEDGVAKGVVTMSSGTHFLTLDGTTVEHHDGETNVELGYTPFLAALKAALEDVGAGTYSVVHFAGANRIAITVSGAVSTFRLQSLSTVAQRVLGMTVAQSDAEGQAGDVAPWYRIETAQGVLSEYFWDEEEDGDLGEDVRAHDGTAFAIAEDEVAVLFDATIPLEPRAAVWTEHASSSAPFTWQRLFRAVRNVEPVALAFSDGAIARRFFVRFRRDGRLFKPVARQTKNWWEYADIPIRARLIGRT